jgi:hypothetical protein
MKNIARLTQRIALLKNENEVLQSQEIESKINHLEFYLKEYKRYGQRKILR